MRAGVVAATVTGVVMVCGGLLAARGAGGPQRTAVPTFTKDIAPIVYKNCTTCHRPGGIGPMSLLTYDVAKKSASDIRDMVDEGHMPPWHADERYGKFLNERRLTPQEKQTILRWVDGGAPRGNPADQPAPPAYVEGWQIGAPDVVFDMPRSYDVPAHGTIEYQYFETPTNFTEDKWIQAIEIRPGARKVVHHVLVYCREPGPNTRPRVLQQRADLGLPSPPPQPPGTPAPESPLRNAVLIATTAPGTNAMTFKPGTALRIKAGAVLIFQMHYTAHGEPTTDRSGVGMVFAKTPPTEEMRASSFINGQFEIPAGAVDYRVDSDVTFGAPAHVYGLFPHTHVRGTRWEYKLVLPDGTSQMILAVPHYDFNWQTYYLFSEPLAVPKGAKIVSSAWYDNSKANKFNPDATKAVRWGDQTWEEMQYTGILYTADPPPAAGGGQ